jgi:hypothetical protein
MNQLERDLIKLIAERSTLENILNLTLDVFDLHELQTLISSQLRETKIDIEKVKRDLVNNRLDEMV